MFRLQTMMVAAVCVFSGCGLFAPPVMDAGTGCPDVSEPNDTRETSTTLGVGQTVTACVGGASDPFDFFEFTAPDAGAGGVINVAVTNVTPVAGPDVTLFAVADNGSIVNAYTTDNGKSVFAWASVAPGAKYRVKLAPFAGGARFGYDLSLSFTALVDPYEPNNRREDAKPITVGTAVQASVGAVSAASTLSESDTDDWYKVTLAAGAATVRVSNVPSDFTCELIVHDGPGTQVTNAGSGDGANCQVDLPSGTTAGEYLIQLHRFAGLVKNGGEGTPPASYSSSYTLVVTQP